MTKLQAEILIRHSVFTRLLINLSCVCFLVCGLTQTYTLSVYKWILCNKSVKLLLACLLCVLAYQWQNLIT